MQADIVQGLNPRSIDVFRTLSLAWHAFLGLSAKAAEGVGLVGEQERKRKQALSCPDYSTRLQPQLQPQPEHETTQQPEAKRAKLTQAYQANTRTTTEKQLTDAVRQVLCIPTNQLVTYRSPDQKRGLDAVVQGVSPLIVVLPTGGGKILLPFTAAIFDCSQQIDWLSVTILVVSFRALIEDMLVRLA